MNRDKEPPERTTEKTVLIIWNGIFAIPNILFLLIVLVIVSWVGWQLLMGVIFG